MKFEPKYIEDNVNVSRKDHGREFLKLGTILLVIIVSVYLILGFCAELLVTHLPISMEKSLGTMFSRQIDTTSYPATREYAQKILDKLVTAYDQLPPFEYRVDIIDEKTVNAFALPAGRIILFRGLIEKIISEEALAMVLAHELGHYVHRDHLRGLGRGLVLMSLMVVLGGNGQAPTFVMPSLQLMDLRFSRKQEQSADLLAVDTVFRVYQHVAGVLEVYDALEQHNASRFTPSIFSTHPDTRQRKNELLARIASLNYAEGKVTVLPGDGHLPFASERIKEKK